MTAMTDLALALLLGGGFALGLLGVLSRLPRWGALPLERRIAPYVRDVVPDEAMPSGILPRVGVLPVQGRTLWSRLGAAFERMLGGGDALALRLAQAGSAQSPAAFRARQLAWGCHGPDRRGAAGGRRGGRGTDDAAGRGAVDPRRNGSSHRL